MHELTGRKARDPFYTLKDTHPRLMADEATLGRMKVEIDKDKKGDGKKLRTRIISDADDLTLPSSGPLTWQFGDLYDLSKEALRRIQLLGLAWLLDKKDSHLKQAKRELKAICDFPDWNPSHFLDTAGLTLAVAIGYDWFYDELDDCEEAACVSAILKNGLAPGLVHLTGGAGTRWPRMVSNWNIVCNAGLMIGALAVGRHESGLTDEVFRRCLVSVRTGLHGYSPEGSWSEGPQYWSRATNFAAYLLASLQTAVGHEFGLGDLPGLSNTGFFRMHVEGSAVNQDKARLLFNFFDCDEARSGTWCMRWLSWRYCRPEFNWVALDDSEKKPMDLLYFLSARPSDKDHIPRNARFRGFADVAMMRGESSRGDAGFRPWKQDDGHEIFLGIRAGANSVESDHVHLDVGGFVLDTGKLRWAIDIPPVGQAEKPFLADYLLPDYFTLALDKRYRYYRTGSMGHNTLVINGQNQPLGIDTEIIAFGESEKPSLVVAVADLTAAYPDCLRVLRGFALIDGEHVLVVDEVTPANRMSIAWQMHTRATATPGRIAELEQSGGKGVPAQKFFVRLREPTGANFKFKVEEAPDTWPPEQPSTGVRKLVATFRDVVDPTRIEVLLSAEKGTIKVPALLNGPLWTWTVWANEPKHRHRRFPYVIQ